MFVTSFSSIQSAPASQVFKITHKDATAEGVVLATAGWVVEPRRKWLANMQIRFLFFTHSLQSSIGQGLPTSRAVQSHDF